MTNAELVGRLRRYDEQLNALLLNIERDAAVLADRNLSTFNQNTPPMTLDELSNVLIPHLTGEFKTKIRTRSCLQLLVNRSATMVANNIMLDYGTLEAEQKAQFTALFRRWSARSFDWGIRSRIDRQKINLVIFLAQYRNDENGCRIKTQQAHRPMLLCVYFVLFISPLQCLSARAISRRKKSGNLAATTMPAMDRRRCECRKSERVERWKIARFLF